MFETYKTISMVVILVTLLIGLGGLIGNTLAFVGLQRQVKKSPTTFLFQALAAADNMVILLFWAFFLYNTKIIYFNYSDPTMFIRAAYFITPLMEMALLASTLITVLLAVVRYIAVCYPFLARTYCNINVVRYYITTALIFSVAFNELHYVFRGLPSGPIERTAEAKLEARYPVERYPMALRIFEHYLMPLVFIILPLFIIIAITTRLSLRMRAIRRQRSLLTRSQRQKMNTTRILIAVLVVFSICSLPYPIAISLEYFREESIMIAYAILYLNLITYTLYIVNSSVNVIVYSVFNKHYRKSLCFKCKS